MLGPLYLWLNTERGDVVAFGRQKRSLWCCLSAYLLWYPILRPSGDLIIAKSCHLRSQLGSARPVGEGG